MISIIQNNRSRNYFFAINAHLSYLFDNLKHLQEQLEFYHIHPKSGTFAIQGEL